jgi:hypothetical protein
MVTGGLETVFIGDPVDSQDDAIGIGERVRSLGDGADILWFRSNLFLVSTFGDFGAISAFVTVCINEEDKCLDLFKRLAATNKFTQMSSFHRRSFRCWMR